MDVLQMKRLTNYLEFFQNHRSVFFTENKGWRLESPEISRFREELHDTEFPLVFDWVQWITENDEFKDVSNNVQNKIMNADLETLRN